MSIATLPPPAKPIIDDEALTELVYGEVVEKAMSIGAAWYASRIHVRLATFVEVNRVGTTVSEGQFILNAELNLKRRPDVAFVTAEKWPVDVVPPLDGDWDMVPDLAIEVNSQHDVLEPVIDKIEEYFEFGVREVWLVLPRRARIYVYNSPTEVRILTAVDVLETALIPGWKLQLNELFIGPATGRSRP